MRAKGSGSFACVSGVESELEDLLRGAVEESGVPAASAAVLHSGSLAQAAAGCLNLSTGVEATPDSLFQIGSISKAYNATAVMQLVDEGRLDLDLPISTYLPDFRLRVSGAESSITTRHLLTHTSGIDGGEYFGDFGRGDDAVARYVESLAGLGLVHPVGEFHSYCNAGSVVAGRIVEVMTGLQWHAAIRDRILTPAGLADTVVLPEEVVLRRTAAGHVPDETGGALRVASPWMLPFAGGPAGSSICATAADLARFGATHLSEGLTPIGTRLLSTESTQAMQQVQFPEARYQTELRQGLGWMLLDIGGRRVVRHSGSTIGQHSILLLVPDEGLVVAVLTNGPAGGRVMNAVVDLAFRALGDRRVGDHTGPATREPAVAAPPGAVDLSRFVGVYARSGVTCSVEVQADTLVVNPVMSAELRRFLPERGPIVLAPIDEDRFMTVNNGKPSGFGIRPFGDVGVDGRPSLLILGCIARRVDC